MHISDGTKIEIKNLLVRKHRLLILITSTDEQTYGGKFDSSPDLRIELADIQTKLEQHTDDLMEACTFQKRMRCASQREEDELHSMMKAIDEDEDYYYKHKYAKDKALAEMKNDEEDEYEHKGK